MFISKVQPSPIDSRDYIYPTAAAMYLPNSVDLREFAGNVEQQGQTGSCVANAAVSALEILLTRQGNFQDLSRLFHYWNLRKDYSALAGIDEGSYPRDAFKVANKIGVCSETIWPFDESKVNTTPSTAAYTAATDTRAFGYYSIDIGWMTVHHTTALRTIKQAIANGYPVLLAASINEEFQQIYSSTLAGTQSQFVGITNGVTIGNHAFLVVGYKDNVLLIENSWGVYWGCGGYALIDGMALLADTFEAWVCTGINDAPIPRLSLSKQLNPMVPNAMNGEIMADEYSIGVTALLHFDGLDGSTVFKDSATAINWTASGTAAISAAQSKFGGSSFYKSSAGDNCISTPNTTGLNMGTSDFTIELWAYPLALTDFAFLLTKHGESNYNGFSIGFMSDGGLFVNCTGSSPGFTATPATIVTDQWQHIALTRLNNVARVFVNGVLIHTWTNGSDMTNTQPVRVGGFESNVGFTGYVDEVRITKGQCRYALDFAVPIAPFADSIQWWTAAPALTPVAAWDAARVSGNQFVDGVGDNNLIANVQLTDLQASPNKGVFFNTAAFTTPISVPLSGGVIAGWISNYTNSGFGIDGTGAQTVFFEGVDFWMDNYARLMFGSNVGVRDEPQFVAFVYKGESAELYIDGQIVNSITNGNLSIMGYALTVINMMQGEQKKYFHSLAILTGTATLSDLQALETAARTKLAEVVMQNRGFTPALGRRDYQFGGAGYITGTILDKTATPLQCKVQLYDESSKMLTREVWSNATTGSYTFDNIDPTLTYSIITYDHSGKYRAVISDGQRAQIR